VSVWDRLRPYQATIDAALQSWLDIGTAGGPSSLQEAMRYSLLAPGKRLRPLLTLLACEAVGGDISTALPAACAVEMIHTYSLIHDDLPAMDDDDLRRGLPTSHKKYGEAMAILTGDALLTLAFEVLARGYSALTAAVCILELARGAGPVGMVGGQVLDLVSEGRITNQETKPELEAIHRAKTGALFRSAILMGVLVAARGDLNHPFLSNMTRFSEAFGLAFQVTDDILDVQSSSELAGKRVGKDAGRGKLTYPSLLGLDASRAKAQECCRLAVESLDAIGTKAQTLRDLTTTLVNRDR
jgi:geranylgeranyl diphosphate synthase type II